MISVEGLLMRNKPLTNLEILDAVKKLEIPRFRGVFLRDNLPVEPKRMECGILNLDDTAGNGTHWVAWYRDKVKYCFDSYGIQPPDELKRYLRSSIFYNTEQIQPKQEHGNDQEGQFIWPASMGQLRTGRYMLRRAA